MANLAIYGDWQMKLAVGTRKERWRSCSVHHSVVHRMLQRARFWHSSAMQN